MDSLQMSSYITKSAYERLIQLCLEAKPLEACGILACSQSSDVIDTIIPITNAHAMPIRSFSFDPTEWTAAYFDMQKNRQTIVGLFHSHPQTEAIPSSSDFEGFLPTSELSYWIISLKNSAAPYVQPYRCSNGTFTSLQLMLA